MQKYNKAPNGASTLQKRQWTKYLSKGIALTLMHYNSQSILFKAYKNSSYCHETLWTDATSRIKGTYCKNRWCFLCNRIKTARLINNYLPQIQQFENPYFITLTRPTVTLENLKLQIQYFESTWRKIYKFSKNSKYQKEYSPLKGIRKAEITIRPNGLYHYHFHFIVENEAQAKYIVSKWIEYTPDANIKANQYKPADLNSLKELFKYAVKSELKIDSKANIKQFSKRSDLVYTSLRKKQTYAAFGIKKIAEDFSDADLENAIQLDNQANDLFTWVKNDWYSRLTGIALVGKSIPQKVKNLTCYPNGEN